MEKKIKFEDAMMKLTAVVEKLESGEGTLDEMIKLYEEGMSLVNVCEKQLDGYEATIDSLGRAREVDDDAE